MRPVGYYVHHQGMGHFDRARLIASRLKRPCTLIGTMSGRATDDIDTLPLPDDAAAPASASMRDGPRAFHFAPIDFPPVRERMAKIASWVADHNPALVVVDVSVEVALLCRLLSVPTIYVRLAGDRSDPAHLEAFRSADRIVAPFPQSFEHPATTGWVREKTLYAGFIHEMNSDEVASEMPGTIAVVLGAGGSRLSTDDLVAAARATSEYVWNVYGVVQSNTEGLPPNLRLHGFVADTDHHVAKAEILIGAGGDGIFALAVRHGKRFICIPEARPYDEQLVKAQALAACGAAIVRPTWPIAGDWPAVLRAVEILDRRMIAALRSHGSLAEVVAAIEGTAAIFDP